MSGESPDDHEEHKAGAWAASNFLTPPVCAIAALTLAIAALSNQNVCRSASLPCSKRRSRGRLGSMLSGAW